MEPVVDIVKTLAARKGRRLVVGFAAETDALEENARIKLAAKNLDFIVANAINEPGSGFGSETNRVVVFSSGGTVEEIGPAAKSDIADTLIDRFSDALAGI